MRRQRNSKEASLIRLLDQLLRSHDLKINESSDQSAILQTLTNSVSSIPQNDILLHGTRVEAMFSYVAGALGHCEAIKQEDAGELYTVKNNVAVPDFRVVTLEGEEFLVEVKNCHSTGTEYRYRMTKEYLEKLRNYADLFSCTLKIAIYWSRSSLWSLVSSDAFETDGRYYSLSMEQCMKRNEMKIIGDSMVGTVPPIVLKVVPDPSKPRELESDGTIGFVIGDVQVSCDGHEIKDPFERKLALFLFSYGDWHVNVVESKIDSEKPIWIQFVANKDPVEGQHFTTLGFLSRMVSLQFNELTAEAGEIVRLSPNLDPSKLGIIIPADFKGENLRLWRFTMSPNHE